MEALVELMLVTAAVIVAAALLPLRPKVRFALGFSGLVLGAVGVALFVFVTYPRETLLFLGACSVISGSAWGYTQVTSWLTCRTARWSTSIARGERGPGPS